jgi:hypothetical protein
MEPGGCSPCRRPQSSSNLYRWMAGHRAREAAGRIAPPATFFTTTSRHRHRRQVLSTLAPPARQNPAGQASQKPHLRSACGSTQAKATLGGLLRRPGGPQEGSLTVAFSGHLTNATFGGFLQAPLAGPLAPSGRLPDGRLLGTPEECHLRGLVQAPMARATAPSGPPPCGGGGLHGTY